MGNNSTGNVSRVRAGAPHKNTLVTTWQVQVTCIEFIKDVYLSENGNNLSNRTPDVITYDKIKENFHGWGRGQFLTGCDWRDSANPDHYACYIRLSPVVMNVTLRCSPPAPSARTFVLVVDPTLDGDAKWLTSASKSVKWAAGAKEQVVEIATGGALPDEISRYDLRLTWSVKDIAISAADGSASPGTEAVIRKTRHTIFSIYDSPRDPRDNSERGREAGLSGLTPQRLDKITQVLGRRRNPTKETSDLEEIVWKVHKSLNDATGPPYFDGNRGRFVQYDLKPENKVKSKDESKKDLIDIDVMDQWVMWAPSDTKNKSAFPHWNFGACITYAQLMKTMLAMIGIHARVAWVNTWTSQLPNVDDQTPLSEEKIANFDFPHSQTHQFTGKSSGVTWEAQVVLMQRPHHGSESFEGCLFYNKRFYPGAIKTKRYPDDVQRDRRGFSSAMEVLKWWINVTQESEQGQFHRFLVWQGVPDEVESEVESEAKSEVTSKVSKVKSKVMFFDRDGDPYPDASHIDRNFWLPITADPGGGYQFPGF